MPFIKSLEVESYEFSEQLAATILKDVLKSKGTDIDQDLKAIRHRYEMFGLNMTYSIGRESDHIWIHNKSNIRLAIIHYRETSEQITFKVIPINKN